MTLSIPFDNSYANLPDRFFGKQTAEPVSAPKLFAFNQSLAADLGIIPGSDAEMADVFGGNSVPDGANPLAQVYAGHQFGGFVPRLGDGRALLLGEVIDRDGIRRDVQLKGSGRTAFSRRGDGRAWMGPVLREYVMSEAMHKLGVPTTRALAAVETGDRIQRERGYPGAVLTRVASSHIRVGTFQYFYAQQDWDGLQTLFEYARDRHYPETETPLEFLTAVVDAQIALVVKWMSVGFIHGVMNTDNTSISGETIDYGPAAYMDSYHPQTVYSSIDHGGRYAYGNQVNIIAWNMAQLASSLVPLVPDQSTAIEEFTSLINDMQDKVKAAWRQSFGQKIGIETASEDDQQLIEDLLSLMANTQADFTNTFRALGHGTARDQFIDPHAFDAWNAKWQARLELEDQPKGRMLSVNPAFIPRNHRIEQMIQAAVAGDRTPFDRLMTVLADPYTEQSDAKDLTYPPQPDEVVAQTFCGT